MGEKEVRKAEEREGRKGQYGREQGKERAGRIRNGREYDIMVVGKHTSLGGEN